MDLNNILLFATLREIRPTDMTITLIVCLASLGAACLHGWARRTSWAKFTFWLVFVAAFNVAGLLTYLALNHTVVIRCPACGRRRNLQTPTCNACNNPLPAPSPRDVDLVSAT